MDNFDNNKTKDIENADFVQPTATEEEDVVIISEDGDAELAAYKKQAADMTLITQRLSAEFDNYRKRTREQGRTSKEEGKAEVVEKLLPVLDSFSQAVKIIKDKSVLDGICLIYDRLNGVLEGFGLSKTDILGHEFDPEFMNAVMTRKEKGKSGQVVEVILDGYLLNGKVIRPAMVIVGE